MKSDMIKLLYHIIHPEVSIDHKVSYKRILPIFKFHSLEPFLAYAKKLDLLDISEEESKELDKLYHTAIYKTVSQEEEFLLIKKTLSENDVSFLPLKGSLIRALYPAPEMRTMADLDILVPVEKLKQVKKLMVSIGYYCKHEGGNHDIYYKRPFMNVEIHRNMIDESYDLSSYYIDIWDKAIIKESDSSEYILSDEDVYIFLVAHSAKHYRVGGTGVRSVCDIYFYLKKYTELDHDYINKELVKLGLMQYEIQIKAIAFSWFDGLELQDEYQDVADYFIQSGVYGIIKNNVISHIAKEDSKESLKKRKLRYLWKRAFPTYPEMKRIFPSLRYWFILLPFYYIFRILKGLFNGQILSRTKEIHKISEEDVKANVRIIESTGEKI